jgi:hypothetical protein
LPPYGLSFRRFIKVLSAEDFMANNPGAEYESKLAQLFEYHQPRFKRTYDEAMADFNKDFAHVRHKFVKRDYANCMHICVRDRVKRNFEGVPGAYPVELPKKPFTLILDGSVIGIDVVAIIIFKKQSESLATANIQTKAVQDFNTQVSRLSQYVPHIQLAFPWPDTKSKVTNPPSPKSANIVAGYKPNAVFTECERLAIAFPLSRRSARLIVDFTHAQTESSRVIPMQRNHQTAVKSKVRRRNPVTNQQGGKSRKHLKVVEPMPQPPQTKRRKDGEGG